ncbi:DUF2934 domain-containing protein [Lichenifustis flavocetrariae]|uniref:DUF2934 domain-containing protein n=1 Tax=Lichenifustis flavocetrariae TaxID=2949735 RepID=A0AA42CGR6_9HYPH|nr:DUF2934 domain-containing protein [Lichenifustis flavocetrariae]MCW6506843.1 DUF2934 domain-containing protein [Lichenifustis flavocetrariae]
MMAQDPDFDRISKKAHELWEAEGRPHGRDQDHWDQAREIIAIEDSQKDTLLPRDTGAEEPIEEAEEALRNLADFPNLTDQGENLLTSTDREPDLTATPSGKKGRMPKAEVPISDQPGIPPQPKRASAKPTKGDAAPKAASPKSSIKAEVPISDQPGIPPQPKRASAKPTKGDAAPKAASPKSSIKQAKPDPMPPAAAAQPKTASMPEAAKPEIVKPGRAAKKPAASAKEKTQ